MGLALQDVPGDGNCLFHSFAMLDNSKSSSEWRKHLCNQIQAKADFEMSHKWYLDRANDSLGRKFQTFSQFLAAMRGTEWGYSDFISQFATETQAEILVLDSDNRWAYTRPMGLLTVSKTFALLNSSDKKGINRNTLQLLSVCTLCIHLYLQRLF